MWGIENILHLFVRSAEYSRLSIVAFIIMALLVLFGYLYIRRTDKRFAFLMASWFILPTLFYMSFVTGQTAMRYYIPAIPAFIILSVGALYFIADRFKAKF